MPRRPKDAPPAPSGADMAVMTYMLDCDERTVQKLAQAGVVIRLDRGKYNALLSARNYIAHLRERAAGRESKDSQVDAVTENALLKRASRGLIELKQQQAAGKLIDIEELKELWRLHILGIKAMVLAWPSRVAFELPHLTPHDISKMKLVAEEVLRNNQLGADLPPLPDPPQG
jgi:phage terminase Nu1 subunit (DNA packaging protein)